MVINETKYALFTPAEVELLDEDHIVGTKQTVRWNLDGSMAVVELKSEGVYYNMSYAKTHSEMAEIVSESEWTSDPENELNIEGE